ncbi:MAG: flagellar motor protein MotB [Thermodesulfobacteriota bacterium]
MPPRKREIIVITRPAEDHGAAHGGSWKVAYADFVTALMALFLLLWLLIALKPQQKAQLALYFRSPDVAVKESKDGRPVLGEVTDSATIMQRMDPAKKTQLAVAGKIKALLHKEAQAMEGAGVRVDEEGVSLTIPSAQLFAAGGTELLPGAEALLAQAAAILKKHDVVLEVRGHADDQEAQASLLRDKWVFSAARAAAVLNAIAAQFALPPARMSAAGYADSRPLGPDRTAEERAANRRIEIYYALPTAEHATWP